MSLKLRIAHLETGAKVKNGVFVCIRPGESQADAYARYQEAANSGAMAIWLPISETTFDAL